MSDVRIALRLLTRRPGFSAAIVLTLAIALGAATAIFSLLYAIALRPLPFPDAERLVTVEAVVASHDGRLTLNEYRELSRDSRAFEGWAAYYRSQYNLTGGGPPEALTCTIGSSTVFHVLGVKPALGEIWPTSMDFTRQYLVVLSHRLWRQRFGGRQDVIGTSMMMDGATYRVVGVMPDGFDYPIRTDVYRSVTDYNAPHVRHYSVLARVRQEATLADAQAELDRFAAKFARDFPETNTGVALRATSLRDAYVGRARPFVWLLAGAVGLLLLIASVNITNLLLSRAIGATAESAVRLALGARRWHVVRQSIVEAVILSLLGVIAAVLAAQWTLGGLTALVAADLPPWFDVSLDRSVLAFAAAIALLNAFAIGAAPALQASRVNIESVLRQESGRGAGGRRQQRARQLMLGAQAAFATMLLIAAGIFAAGLRDLLRVDPGFDQRRLLTFRVDPPFVRYPDIRTTSEFYRRAIESLRAIPGVDDAAANNALPFSGVDLSSPRVSVEGRSTVERADEQPFANIQLVDPSYFRVMRIPLRQGRAFTETDREGTPRVAIVNERAARRFWGGEAPLGKRIELIWNQSGTGFGGGSDLTLTIVGVAGNVRFRGIDDESTLDVYAPHTQLFAGDSYLVARTRMNPEAATPQLRAAIDRVDPDQSFFDVATADQRVNGSIWQHRVAAAVLTVFAAVALALAVIGTYAVTAYAVASQQRELGIRLALGSPVAGAIWLVVGRSLVPFGIGAAAGLAAGAGVARALAAMIGLNTAPDFGALALLPISLVLFAMVASYLPVHWSLRRLAVSTALRGE